MSDYPKSKGGLWINRNKQGEQPDWRGKIEISDDQLRMLIKMKKEGFEPNIQLGAWKRKSEAGQPYIHLSGEAYIPTGNSGGGSNRGGSSDWDDEPRQPQRQAQRPQQRPRPKQQQDEWDDGLPQVGGNDDDFMDDDIPF